MNRRLNPLQLRLSAALVALLLSACAYPGRAGNPGWGRPDAYRPPPEWMALAPATRIVHPEIGETSGIVELDGAFYVHNDSGDRARLFRSTRLDFADAEELPLAGAEAIDWEDITIYRGDLLICDSGDNLRTRADVTLYRAAYVGGGPDRSGVRRGGHLELRSRFPVRFADGPHDVEAAFTMREHLYLVTKDRGDGSQVLRFAELQDAAALPPGGANVPERVAELDLGGEQVTAGAYDAEHDVVFLLTYSGILVYPGSRLEGLPALVTRTWARQAEAIWARGDSLIFTNEQRDVFVLEHFLTRAPTQALPPAGHARLVRRPVSALIDGNASDWASLASAVPLRDARTGESLLWLESAGRVLLSGRFRIEADFLRAVPDSQRSGSGVLLSFAASDPRPTFLDGRQTQLFFGVDESGQAGIWRLTFTGYQLASMAQLPGAVIVASVDADRASADRWFTFEAAILRNAIGPLREDPPGFAFDLQGIGLRAGDEVHFSAADLFSIFRPYAWGEVEIR